MFGPVVESSVEVVGWIDTRTTSIASILMTLAMVLGLGGLIRAERQYQTARRLRSDSLTDLRTLPSEETPHEVHGIAKPYEGTFTAPFTGVECVAYLYDVIADPDGDPQRIAFGGEMGPFYVETESGTALVDLEEVTFDVERGDEYEVGPHGSVPASIWRRVESIADESKRPDLPDEIPDGGMVLVERRVEPDTEVYAIGETESSEDGDARVRLVDGEATDSRISDSSGAELASRYRRSAILSLLGGVVLLSAVAAVYLV